MESKDFCYWLKGFLEISEAKTISEKQVEVIKNHLKLVFIHEIDPSLGNGEYLKKLQGVHDGKVLRTTGHPARKGYSNQRVMC